MAKALYIAEKPSVAQEFAKALKINGQRKDGYLESDDSVVTWCVGHLVTMSYPEKYDTGFEIDLSGNKSSEVFVAGAKLESGVLFTSGGRVLGVTAVGDTLDSALETAYADVKRITFKNAYYRDDIGARALSAFKD